MVSSQNRIFCPETVCFVPNRFVTFRLCLFCPETAVGGRYMEWGILRVFFRWVEIEPLFDANRTAIVP
ncbi:MAG: hypothetical protein LKI39_15305 [Bacteroides sp.]|nr:hypothetical protein [Bacteroides sp.]